MPTLDWIGKKGVVGHHRQVPYRLLHCNAKLSAGDPDAGNLLVQGDNLLALKALLPYYAGKVKCIYIDPPYNTGTEGWIYNDNVDSPVMKAWLGQAVGKEAEDLSRHDKWLCMMYPRLALLKEFLTDDGVIFVSIDDNEVHHLRAMMDEVFGSSRRIGCLIWKSRQQKDNRNTTGASIDHEYVLCYGHRLRGAERDRTQYSNPDNDPRGDWTSSNMVGLATRTQRPNLHFDLIDPATQINYGCPAKGWRYEPATMQRLGAERKILWPASPTGRPRRKFFLSELEEEFTGFSSIVGEGIFTRHGTVALRDIFSHDEFSFPKPVELVRALVEQVAGENDLVLDSFAGSGTTGHAVLAMNRTDGGSRRFILVEMDENIATAITGQRLARVIEGYQPGGDKGKEYVAGTGGGFRYCMLGEPLFDEAGNIQESVKFSDLAAHVFFTETGSPIPKRATGKTPLLGVHDGTAIYLLFNGAMGDRRVNGGNVLTTEVLRKLPEHDGPKVVYGEGCRLGKARLKREGIVFRQIPYEVKVS